MSRTILLCTFQRKAFLPFDNDRFDAFEEHGKLGGTDEGDGFAFAGESHGNSEATGFETFVPKGVTVTIPVKNLESVGRTIDENEKGSVEWILLETVFDNGGQTVERFPHVDGSRRNVNGAMSAVQHGMVSSCRMIPQRASEGVSRGKRRIKPFFVTSSILSLGTVEGDSTWMGKKASGDGRDGGEGTREGVGRDLRCLSIQFLTDCGEQRSCRATWATGR